MTTEADLNTRKVVLDLQFQIVLKDDFVTPKPNDEPDTVDIQ